MGKIYSAEGKWYELGAGLSESQVKLWMEEESKDLCDGLSVPVLKAKQSWYQGSTLREEIENIVITDNYTETGTEAESWIADDEDSGDITCYVDGTTLIIASNRTGGLAMNANSEFAFAGFTGAVTMTGQELLRVDRVHRGYGLFKNGGFKALGADSWNFRRAYNLIQAFMGCAAMVTANLGQSTLRNVNSLREMFRECTALVEVISPRLAVEDCISTRQMFYDCPYLESVDTGRCTFEKCTDMNNMFRGCHSLPYIDCSSWRLRSCVEGQNMFSSLTKSVYLTGMQITEIKGVENFNMGQCTDMSHMFYGCQRLKRLDLSTWDVRKVTDFSHIFADTTAMQELILNDGMGNAWQPESAVSFNAMFNDCGAAVLDVSSFSCAKAMCLSQMFERARGEIVGYELLDTSEATEMVEMFSGTKMEIMDFSGYDTGKVTSTVQSGDVQSLPGMGAFLLDAKYLRRITLGAKFSTVGDGTLTAEQQFTLPVPSADYIEGADGYWYEADGTRYAPDAPPNPAVMSRAVTLHAVDPTA